MYFVTLVERNKAMNSPLTSKDKCRSLLPTAMQCIQL